MTIIFILIRLLLKKKNKGYGSLILKDLIKYSEESKKPISLFPIVLIKARKSKTNKLNKKRLESFYQKHNFKLEDNIYTGTMVRYTNNI